MIAFVIGIVVGVVAAIVVNAKWPLPFSKVRDKVEDVLGV